MTDFKPSASRIVTDLVSTRSNPSTWNREKSRLTVSRRRPR